jgi:hypothetical protein
LIQNGAKKNIKNKEHENYQTLKKKMEVSKVNKLIEKEEDKIMEMKDILKMKNEESKRELMKKIIEEEKRKIEEEKKNRMMEKEKLLNSFIEEEKNQFSFFSVDNMYKMYGEFNRKSLDEEEEMLFFDDALSPRKIKSLNDGKTDFLSFLKVENEKVKKKNNFS